MSEHWAGARVVVGGGAGFLGSYLVPALVSRGASVTVVDNFENGPSSLPESVAASVTVVEGDLGDRPTCERVLRGCDLFINLAAKASGVGFSRTHHGEMLIDNLLCGVVPLRTAAALQGPARGRDQFLLRLPGRCPGADARSWIRSSVLPRP